jgi:hypothetical protein
MREESDRSYLGTVDSHSDMILSITLAYPSWIELEVLDRTAADESVSTTSFVAH